MNAPAVSVLIPVFNRKRFIGHCIASALAQTYPDIEVVVVDNASTDGTWEVCQHYARIDSRVRIFQNRENLGPVRNWRLCVDLARGVYTKILWSDDLIHPEYLSKTLNYLNQPEIGFVYSSASILLTDIEEAFYQSFEQFRTGIYESRHYIEAALLNQDVPYSPGCAIFRTVDVRANLLLNVRNRVGSDFSSHAIGNDLLLFLLTASAYPKFAVVNETLSYFRIHNGSITTSAPTGKISLHYDMAKGFFIENHPIGKTLFKNSNTEFYLHLLKYKNNKFGISKIRDFYPSKEVGFLDISFGTVFRRMSIFILRRIFLYAKRSVVDFFLQVLPKR
jgi:glycosyltransferase involved in cell wall biosynthesis